MHEDDVLAEIVQQVLAAGYWHLDSASLLPWATRVGMSENELSNTLEFLRNDGYLEHGMRFPDNSMMAYFDLTLQGYLQWVKSARQVPKFMEIVCKSARKLIATTFTGTGYTRNVTSETIAQSISEPHMAVRFALEYLEHEGIISIHRDDSGRAFATFTVLPDMKRFVRDNCS